MLNLVYKFKGKMWVYPGEAVWYFVSVPKEMTTKIKKTFAGMQRGFGSLPVRVTIGQSAWKTSVFPENKSGMFMLPLKAKIRKIENIKPNQILNVGLEILSDLPI